MSTCFETYEERANNPKMWVYRGDELKYSAEVLMQFGMLQHRENRKSENDVVESTFLSVLPQAFMLYGFALENYAKALIVNRKMHSSCGSSLNIMTHDIYKLIVNYLSIPLSEPEKKCLHTHIPHPAQKIGYFLKGM